MATIVENELLLSIENVSVTYDGSPIVREINAQIHDIVRTDGVGITPQIVAFVGPSGSGKSTIFRVLSGLEKPTTGRVLLGANAVPVHPGLVGVVPQDYLIFPFLKVIDTLILAGMQGGMTRKEARSRATDLLSQYSLASCSGKYPSQLSGGQRQRISIIEQLLCSSHYLLMDEPFSGLDPSAKDEIAHLIWDVASKDEKYTVIITSHDVETCFAHADRAWVLGKQRDAEGKKIPGSTILNDINLNDMGFAWREDILQDPHFLTFVAEIKRSYKDIK